MKIDRENGFAFIDERQFSICTVCDNEKFIGYDFHTYIHIYLLLIL